MRKKKKIAPKGVPPLLLNLSSAGVNNNNAHNTSLLHHSSSQQNFGGTQLGQTFGEGDPISQSFQVSLGIDFTFNTIKNVKKVNWKDDAPWYREISDGMCWLCYCQNPKCLAHK
jgi:hypothetical protein